MNPKEFDWAEDQTVTVTNPTADDYAFKVHSKDYMVKAGDTAKMPGYIAWVYVYGLASRMAQKAGDFHRWNEEGFRQTYFDKVVVGADDVVQTIETTPYIEKVNAEQSVNATDKEEQEAFPTVKKEVKNGRSPKA